MFAYDGERWSEVASLPWPRGSLVLEAVGGHPHALGGDPRPFGATGRPSHAVYDPDADEWRESPPMPTGREHLGDGVVDETVFVVGGRRGIGANLAVTEAFDPASGECSERSAMPTRRYGLGVVALDGSTDTVAGRTTPGVTVSSVLEVYTPARPERRR